jgi:hypothetical protein
MGRFNVVANVITAHFGSLMECLCGCSHRHSTFPMTLPVSVRPNGGHAAHAETYVVCVDCGRHLPYDWTTMQRINESAAGSTPGLTVNPVFTSVYPSHG